MVNIKDQVFRIRNFTQACFSINPTMLVDFKLISKGIGALPALEVKRETKTEYVLEVQKKQLKVRSKKLEVRLTYSKQEQEAVLRNIINGFPFTF